MGLREKVKGWDLSKISLCHREVGIVPFGIYFFYVGIEHIEFTRVIPHENINNTESTPKHEHTKNKIAVKFLFSMAYSISENIEPNKLFSKHLYN